MLRCSRGLTHAGCAVPKSCSCLLALQRDAGPIRSENSPSTGFHIESHTWKRAANAPADLYPIIRVGVAVQALHQHCYIDHRLEWVLCSSSSAE